MSSIEMASAIKFPYRRLSHEDFFDRYEERGRIVFRSRSWFKFRKVHGRRRFRLKVPSLRRFFRRKVRLVSAVRVSCAKVVKRFKEGKGYFGDLFAGNYLFLQINPSSLKSLERSYYDTGINPSGLTPRYSLPRVA